MYYNTLTTQDFLKTNYEEIMLMSKKICKSNSGWEDVAHFCIIKFQEHERFEELVATNKAMKFLSGMIYRSYWSNTSQYYTEYHQKGRVSPVATIYDDAIPQQDEYDMEKDIAIEGILGVIEDMKTGGIEQWYKATLLEMWAETPNYSELSRRTKIPRTSISKSVEEAMQYVRQQLKNNNIDYDNS